MSDLPQEEIELSRGTKGLGFNIKGGLDQPHLPNDTGIFVTKLREDGAAFIDGRLKKGDRILMINNVDVTNVPHKNAVDLFVNAGDKVTLVVQHGAEEELKKQTEEEEPKSNVTEPSGDGGSYLPILFGLVFAVAAIGFFAYKRFK